MVEFRVQVEEDIVKEYGKEILEQYLKDYLSKAILKLISKELLEDQKNIDLKNINIEEARNRAWNYYGKNHFLEVSANA